VVGTQPAKTNVEDSENPVRSGVSWWWIAPCAFVLVAIPFVWRPLWQMAGAMSAPTSFAGPVPESASRLGFSAAHEGTDWRLVWNREALKRLGAVGALLSIRDGGVDRLQFLSPLDLAAGAILYVPKSSDLLFNLKITLADGPDIEEQIRVLGQDQDAAADLNYPPPRRIGEAARTSLPGATSPSGAPTGAAAPQPVKQFQPPPAPSRAPAAPREVALPDIRMPATAAPALRFTGTLAPPKPTPAAAPAAPTPQIITPLTTHVDAAPVRTVIAQWPRGAARQSLTEVRIRVRIDPQGRVVGATPLDRTVANFPFVDSAMAAARLWTFSPATENGKPVASETVLTFKFNP
jgi:protein TonB